MPEVRAAVQVTAAEAALDVRVHLGILTNESMLGAAACAGNARRWAAALMGREVHVDVVQPVARQPGRRRAPGVCPRGARLGRLRLRRDPDQFFQQRGERRQVEQLPEHLYMCVCVCV